MTTKCANDEDDHDCVCAHACTRQCASQRRRPAHIDCSRSCPNMSGPTSPSWEGALVDGAGRMQTRRRYSENEGRWGTRVQTQAGPKAQEVATIPEGTHNHKQIGTTHKVATLASMEEGVVRRNVCDASSQMRMWKPNRRMRPIKYATNGPNHLETHPGYWRGDDQPRTRPCAARCAIRATPTILWRPTPEHRPHEPQPRYEKISARRLHLALPLGIGSRATLPDGRTNDMAWELFPMTPLSARRRNKASYPCRPWVGSSGASGR